MIMKLAFWKDKSSDSEESEDFNEDPIFPDEETFYIP